jgi:hypothetical protein
LTIRRTSGGSPIETVRGSGHQFEKAQDIASQVVSRTFGPDCSIVWTPVLDWPT